jgi:hypothetical protein
MTRVVNQRCDIHPDVFDCPDQLIYYSTHTDAYGLIIHDGGSSFSVINFCPWCGAHLSAAASAVDQHAER